MHIGTQVKRALAVSTTLAVASLGAVTTAQAMDPGNGNGNGKGNGHGHGQTKEPDQSGKGKQDKDASKQSGQKDTQQPGKKNGQGNGHGKRQANGHAGHGKGQGNGNGKGQGNGHAGHGQQLPAGHQGNGGGHGNGGAGHSTGSPGTSAPGASAPDAKAATGTAGKGDPPGNNGTVKITPPGEDDGIPQNHPHQGCVFDIEWYGFDRGDGIWSTVVLEDHSPTADGGHSVAEGDLRVFVGGDPAGGGTDFDGEETYRLDFTGEPHPKQGHHVKLTVHTPGSQGADTKHKVYWVSGCEGVSPPTETPTTPGEETTSPGGETTSPPEVAGTESSSPPAGPTETAAGPPGNGPDVKGVQETSPANLPTAVNAGVATVKWVASPLPLLVVLLGGLVAGLGYLVRRRNA